MNVSSPTAAQALPELFAQHGLRCTRQRLRLYEALATTAAHPTADEIHHRMCASQEDISLATVYNTLEAFCRAGLAQKLPGSNGSARYDATVTNHLHLRDQSNGLVADVPEGLSRRLLEHIPPQIIEQLEAQLGFRIQHVQIELIGSYEKARQRQAV